MWSVLKMKLNLGSNVSSGSKHFIFYIHLISTALFDDNKDKNASSQR